MLQKASLTFFTFHAIPQIKIIRKKLHIGYTKYSTKQKQENKSTLRCASLRGVEFFSLCSARWICSLVSIYNWIATICCQQRSIGCVYGLT